MQRNAKKQTNKITKQNTITSKQTQANKQKKTRPQKSKAKARFNYFICILGEQNMLINAVKD